MVLLLSLIAPVLNPYGAAAYVFPFQTVFSPAVQSLIHEWSSPNFQDPTARGLQLFIVALPALLAFGARRVDARGLVVAAGLLLMTLQSTRYDLLFALIGIPLLAPGLVAGARSLLDRLGYNPSPFRRPATVALNLAAVVVLVGCVAFAGVRLSDRAAQDEATSQTQPVAAAAADSYLPIILASVSSTNTGWAGYLY